MLGRGKVGLRGIGVSGSGYNEVLVLEVLKVIDRIERGRSADLHRWRVSVAVLLRVGRCRGYTCVFVYICMCMHMYVCIYVCVHFFCSECWMHFETGVLGTSACANVYMTQVFLTQTYTSANILVAGCAHVCICINVCVYACICCGNGFSIFEFIEEISPLSLQLSPLREQ